MKEQNNNNKAKQQQQQNKRAHLDLKSVHLNFTIIIFIKGFVRDFKLYIYL